MAEEARANRAAICRAVCSNTKLKFSLLPSEKMVFFKLMRKGHMTGSRNGDEQMRKCQVGCKGKTDNHEHVFFECSRTVHIWMELLNIFDKALPGTCNAAARVGVVGGDMAMCIAGLQPNGKPAPQWWLLIQRVAARWIWVRYTDMKYGGNELSKYESVVSHVLSDVELRLVTYWNEAHSSVVRRVDLKSNEDEKSKGSLKNARQQFAELFGPLATLKMGATRNEGRRGRQALRLSKEFSAALKSRKKA